MKVANNPDANLFAHNVSKQAPKKSGGMSFSSMQVTSPASLDSIQLNGGDGVLATSFARVGNSGISASVFWHESSTPDNPVMLVRGVNVDRTPFEVKVNINEVDPRNASFIEMTALDAYLTANGQDSRAARTANGLEAAGATTSGLNAFSQIDFLSLLQSHMETQRLHSNMNAFMELKHNVDALLNHVAGRVFPHA